MLLSANDCANRIAVALLRQDDIRFGVETTEEGNVLIVRIDEDPEPLRFKVTVETMELEEGGIQ